MSCSDLLTYREVTDVIKTSHGLAILACLSSQDPGGLWTHWPHLEAHTELTSTVLMHQSRSCHWLLWAQNQIRGLSHILSYICWMPCKDTATVWGGGMYYEWGFSSLILFDSSCESLGDALNNLLEVEAARAPVEAPQLVTSLQFMSNEACRRPLVIPLDISVRPPCSTAA